MKKRIRIINSETLSYKHDDMNASQLLELFLQAKSANNLAPETITGYRFHCERFIESMGEKKDLPGYLSCTLETYQNFILLCQNRGLSDVSTASTARSIRAWLYWLMVQSNSCISYGKNYYSIPYQHIGERVTLLIYNDRLEAWCGAEHLCTHKLVTGRIGVYQTDNSHFPPYSSSYGDWNSDRFRRWAREYGPYTYEVIDRLFSGGGAEQKYYNGARSILNWQTNTLAPE